MKWHEWITNEWFPFKEEVNKRLKSLEINELQCQGNHLPSIDRKIDENSIQIKKLRKWLWITMALIIYLAFEFDKVDKLIEFFRHFVGG